MNGFPPDSPPSRENLRSSNGRFETAFRIVLWSVLSLLVLVTVAAVNMDTIRKHWRKTDEPPYTGAIAGYREHYGAYVVKDMIREIRLHEIADTREAVRAAEVSPECSSIWCQGPKITPEDLRRIGKLPWVKKFHFQSGYGEKPGALASEHIEALATCHSLEEISFHGGLDESIDLSPLGNLVQLKKASLFLVIEHDAGAYDFLKHLKDLESLSLLFATLSDKSFRNIASLKQLKSLHIDSSDVTDERLAVISMFPNLESAGFYSESLTDSGLRFFLKHQSHLHELRISSKNITDVSIPALIQCKSLRDLHISGTKISYEGLERLEREMPDCHIHF